MEEINKIIEEFGYKGYTLIEINGEKYAATEVQVRALQVLCHREAKAGRFAEFNKKYTVYSDISGTEKMIFREDGKFRTKFKKGFYDVCDRMAFEIF